jgi:hypothetical protein
MYNWEVILLEWVCLHRNMHIYIPYHFEYKTHILHIFFPPLKNRGVLNSRNVHLSNFFFLKPTIKKWMNLKFEGVLYSKECSIVLLALNSSSAVNFMSLKSLFSHMKHYTYLCFSWITDWLSLFRTSLLRFWCNCWGSLFLWESLQHLQCLVHLPQTMNSLSVGCCAFILFHTVNCSFNLETCKDQEMCRGSSVRLKAKKPGFKCETCLFAYITSTMWILWSPKFISIIFKNSVPALQKIMSLLKTPAS